MATLIEPNELHPAGKPPIQISCIIDADDVVEHIVIPAGQHPRMRLITDAAYNLTFNSCLAFTSTDAVIAVKKGRDRKSVGVFAGGHAAIGDVEVCTPSAEAAGVNENITIFERYDDVVVQATTGGNAASSDWIQLTFEVIE